MAKSDPTDGKNSKTVAALTSHAHLLSDQQKMFVDCIVKGMSPLQAGRAAGYKTPEKSAYQAMKSEKIQNAIQEAYKKNSKVSEMSRKRVMDGMLEAIEMAKIQGESGVMVNGWREIGRMCGYYAPETKKIDINITAKRIIDKMETLSDSELLEMIEDSGEMIEGVATLVDPG